MKEICHHWNIHTEISIDSENLPLVLFSCSNDTNTCNDRKCAIGSDSEPK